MDYYVIVILLTAAISIASMNYAQAKALRKFQQTEVDKMAYVVQMLHKRIEELHEELEKYEQYANKERLHNTSQ